MKSNQQCLKERNGMNLTQRRKQFNPLTFISNKSVKDTQGCFPEDLEYSFNCGSLEAICVRDNKPEVFPDFPLSQNEDSIDEWSQVCLDTVNLPISKTKSVPSSLTRSNITKEISKTKYSNCSDFDRYKSFFGGEEIQSQNEHHVNIKQELLKNNVSGFSYQLNKENHHGYEAEKNNSNYSVSSTQNASPIFQVVPQGILKSELLTIRNQDTKHVTFNLSIMDTDAITATQTDKETEKPGKSASKMVEPVKSFDKCTYEQVIKDTKIAKEYCERNGIELGQVPTDFDADSDPLFPLTQNINQDGRHFQNTLQEVPGNVEWSQIGEQDFEMFALYEEAKNTMQQKRQSFELGTC